MPDQDTMGRGLPIKTVIGRSRGGVKIEREILELKKKKYRKHGIFVFCSYCNKLPQTLWVKTTGLILPQFWRPEV